MKWLILILVILAACTTQPQATETNEPNPQSAEAKAMDIATATQLGQPIKCTSMYEGQTSTIYMKGSKMRIDTMPVDAHGIYTEDTMYTWQGNQGMIMKVSEVKQMAKSQGTEYQAQTQDDVVQKAQQSNAKCEPASIPESMFTPPSEVQFQDLGKMMMELENTAKDLQR